MKKPYIWVTLSLAAIALAGLLAYTWRAKTVEQPYKEQPLDPRGPEEWRERCIKQAKKALQWLDKVNYPTTPAECAACLDADAKFLRLYVIDVLYWAPDSLRRLYEQAELSNDSAQRRELKLRIQEYAKTPEATQAWSQSNPWSDHQIDRNYGDRLRNSLDKWLRCAMRAAWLA